MDTEQLLKEILPLLGRDPYDQDESLRMDVEQAVESFIDNAVKAQIVETDSILRDAMSGHVDYEGEDDDALRELIDAKFEEVKTLRKRLDELVDADEDPEEDDARIRLIDAKISDASNAGDLWREVYWDLRGGDRDLDLGPEDAAATEAEAEPWEEHYRDLRADLAEAAICAEWDRDAEIEPALLVRRAGRVLINEVGLLQDVNLSRLFERHRAELSRALAEALNPRIEIQTKTPGYQQRNDWATSGNEPLALSMVRALGFESSDDPDVDEVLARIDDVVGKAAGLDQVVRALGFGCDDKPDVDQILEALEQLKHRGSDFLALVSGWLSLDQTSTLDQVKERIKNCSAVFCLLGADLDWPVARVDAQIDTISDGAYSNWIQVCNHLGVEADCSTKKVISWIDDVYKSEPTPGYQQRSDWATSGNEPISGTGSTGPIRAALGLGVSALLEDVIARIGLLKDSHLRWINVCSALDVNHALTSDDVLAWIKATRGTPLDSLVPIRARLGLDDDATTKQILTRISAILGSSVNQLLAAGGRI